MRGKDQQSDSLFSYIRLETRIPADHPLRPIRKLVDEGLLELSPAFSKLYARGGRPAGTAVASAFAPGALYRAFGTPVDGATRIQSSVPLVRRPVDGRRGLGCHSFLQEPGSSVGRLYCP